MLGGAVPKILAPLGGQPLLHRLLLGQLGTANRIVLCTGHLADTVQSWVEAMGWDMAANIRFSREKVPLGTGGALRLARPLLHSDPVIVMNGDTVLKTKLCPFLKKHSKSGNTGSIMYMGGVSAGLYAISQHALEHFWLAKEPSLEVWAFAHWKPIEHSGFFVDMGTPQGYEAAQELVE